MKDAKMGGYLVEPRCKDRMSVSVSSGILDLFAPKFGLDGFGVPGEKVMIRVAIVSTDGSRKMTAFGNYTIGSRHAQIASREMERVGGEVQVVSVTRYTLKDFIEDVNQALGARTTPPGFRFVWEDGKTLLDLGGKPVPITFHEMYPTAAKACGVFECKGKSAKAMLGSGEVELFDLQRRKLSGLRLKQDKLILEREFQNPA
jgi:hypothetical protein